MGKDLRLGFFSNPNGQSGSSCFFGSVIITYFPLPAFHSNYANNNYSNEPLGFGGVSWQLLGLVPKMLASFGLFFYLGSQLTFSVSPSCTMYEL